MLGKLIRYDGKIQIKFLGGVCIVAVVISLFAGLMRALSGAFPKMAIFSFARTLAGGFCIIAAITMVIGTMIYSVVYYRRNLFRDEGYLMHTLPVTGTQLFMSKLLTGTVCVYLSVIAAWLCICIGLGNKGEEIMMLLEESGLKGTGALPMIVAAMFLMVPVSLSQFFASLSIGYTWKVESSAPMNRDLLSVVTYIILYFVQQIISLVALTVWFAVSYRHLFGPGFLERLDKIMQKDMIELSSYFQVFGVSIGLSVVLGVAFTVVSIWRMSRYLNLE